MVDRVGTLQLDVALRRRPHVLFAWDAKQRQELEREAQAAAAAGLDVRLTDDDLGLPFATTGALVRDDQAELEIGAYVQGLADAFTAIGGQSSSARSSRTWARARGRSCAPSTGRA